MVKQDSTRIGVQVTSEDKKILRKLKTQLREDHGDLTVTAIFRIAIRRLVKP